MTVRLSLADTTVAYKYLNSPLRDQGAYYHRGKPHPLPRTIAYIDQGIRKLRAAYALMVTRKEVEPAGALWRGIKNLEMSDKFMADRTGGTELAPMSTSTSIGVATRYALSGQSLLFKIKLDNFME